MSVRVCDRCIRYLVGARAGQLTPECPYCAGPLRSALPREVQQFIEELRCHPLEPILPQAWADRSPAEG